MSGQIAAHYQQAGRKAQAAAYHRRASEYARRLYANREAVVEGDQRWTYAGFFERCDRWSAALQR